MSVPSQESIPVDRPSRVAAPMQTLFDVGTFGGLTDGQLLERFLRGGRAVAEAAFTLLVQRHGPMVLRVGQGVLRDRHKAEDAFQATFLVLARQAGSIRREDAVAIWLYGVARRLSLRSRRRAAYRRELEQRRLAAMGSVEPASGPPTELWPELYEELDRLPEPFRAAVVLCDLEGNSYDQAAEMPHCPVGTIQSRLSRGRQRLRRRLERRGLGSALVLVGGGPVASPIAMRVPQTLALKVVRAAASVAGGESIRGLAPAAVIGLAGSELRRHLLARTLTVVGTLCVAALVVGGVAMLTGGQQEKNRELLKATTNPPPKANTGPVHVRVVDTRGKRAQLIEFHQRILGGWGSSQADDQGRFAITGLEPGVYNLLFERVPGRPLATARAVEGVRVRGGQSTTALRKLIEGRPLRGVVIDRATEQPVAGIQVGCYGPARPQSGAAVQGQKTDLHGAFTFHVPPGQHFVFLMEGNQFSRLSRSTIDVPEQGEIELVKLFSVPVAVNPQTSYVMKVAVPAPEPAPKPENEVKKVAIRKIESSRSTGLTPRT